MHRRTDLGAVQDMMRTARVPQQEDERGEEIAPRTEECEGECVTYVFVRKA